MLDAAGECAADYLGPPEPTAESPQVDAPQSPPALRSPMQPMVARPTPQPPRGPWVYEPKLDGARN